MIPAQPDTYALLSPVKPDPMPPDWEYVPVRFEVAAWDDDGMALLIPQPGMSEHTRGEPRRSLLRLIRADDVPGFLSDTSVIGWD